MWISEAHYRTLDGLVTSAQNRSMEMLRREGALNQQIKDLEAELIRARNDIKWFMHRLNQVESERAAMFFQHTGTRIAAPQFKDPEQEKAEQLVTADILNALGAPFTGVGDDSPDPADHLPEQEDGTEDYSHLPGYRGRQ